MACVAEPMDHRLVVVTACTATSQSLTGRWAGVTSDPNSAGASVSFCCLRVDPLLKPNASPDDVCEGEHGTLGTCCQGANLYCHKSVPSWAQGRCYYSQGGWTAPPTTGPVTQPETAESGESAAVESPESGQPEAINDGLTEENWGSNDEANTGGEEQPETNNESENEVSSEGEGESSGKPESWGDESSSSEDSGSTVDETGGTWGENSDNPDIGFD